MPRRTWIDVDPHDLLLVERVIAEVMYNLMVVSHLSAPHWPELGSGSEVYLVFSEVPGNNVVRIQFVRQGKDATPPFWYSLGESTAAGTFRLLEGMNHLWFFNIIRYRVIQQLAASGSLGIAEVADNQVPGFREANFALKLIKA
ncbi:MAG: hypothetical protein A3A33_05205 [Candidatus Yanofskybacteria bacterium RIFCSPLOWO2_01_FULL_49_25]|uniref:Uncharacterized protein n=1 Tax=Candidatus Yanofskybacteria bacterium RIFCSPLOWO2_01_FULL_49_25 TaxID=1802701 RepID=A0A1F8GUM4_9BACT|nr:MAG: hypothetical protein A3A33_05205 [Candidatus Yanofskybacteria bacterium RIFCSPLOWO2_01_FULL_49_25]